MYFVLPDTASTYSTCSIPLTCWTCPLQPLPSVSEEVNLPHKPAATRRTSRGGGLRLEVTAAMDRWRIVRKARGVKTVNSEQHAVQQRKIDSAYCVLANLTLKKVQKKEKVEDGFSSMMWAHLKDRTRITQSRREFTENSVSHANFISFSDNIGKLVVKANAIWRV